MGLVLGRTACQQKAPQPQAGARTETTEKAGAEAAEAPGGNGENAALTNNETMIAMAGAPDYVFVMEELPTESGDIDSVGVFNQLVSVIVVKADSPYQTLDDLVGKKINLGAAGSASVCLTRH